MSIKWGDRKLASELLKQFSGTTTVHGFRYLIGESCNWKLWKTWKTWLWRIFLGICVYLVVSGIYQITVGFLREPTQVVTAYKLYEDGPHIDPLFPTDMRITICKRPSWGGANLSQSILLKYGFMALGSPLFSLAKDELKHVSEFDQDLRGNTRLPRFVRYMEDSRNKYNELMKAGYDEVSFIHNFSLSCMKVFEHEKLMCKEYERVLTIRGPCYTKIYKDSEPSVVEFESSKSQALPESEGFFAVVSHPMESLEYLDSYSAVFIPPGFYVNLNIMLSMTKRHALYTSWLRSTSKCPSLPEEIESNEVSRLIYSVASCKWRHEMYYTEKLRKNKKPNTRYCSPDDVAIGYLHWRQTDIGAEKARRRTLCKKGCSEYEYNLDWKIMKVSGNKSISQLDFYYDREHFYIKEYRNVSVNNVLSQIGGFLGLYLGASIVTLVELVQFIFRWCWYCVAPRRKQVVCLSQFHKSDKAFSEDGEILKSPHQMGK